MTRIHFCLGPSSSQHAKTPATPGTINRSDRFLATLCQWRTSSTMGVKRRQIKSAAKPPNGFGAFFGGLEQAHIHQGGRQMPKAVSSGRARQKSQCPACSKTAPPASTGAPATAAHVFWTGPNIFAKTCVGHEAQHHGAKAISHQRS
jgi:hypothetical protein